jgi:hypothetical protein
MKWKKTSRKTVFYWISAFILFFGLASAVLVYPFNENTSDYEPGHASIYGTKLWFDGNKVHFLPDDLVSWFNEPWEASSLAYTIGCLAILLSYGFLFAGYNSPSGPGKGNMK